MTDKNPAPAARDLEIVNKRGLHARASSQFVKLVETFKSKITVSKDGVTVGGTSIMGLMLLVASKGSTIHVEAEGEDAAAAIEAVSALVADGFGERD